MDSAGVYHHYVRDHLGNNRVVVSQGGAVVQTNHYYLFGMEFSEEDQQTRSEQPYKFGGKEEQAQHGLNFYDFHARQYDPATIRFTSVDPLAEKYYGISSYAYCVNNPVKYVDPDGNVAVLFLYAAAARVMEKRIPNRDIRTLGYAMQNPIRALRVGKYSEGSSNFSTMASNFEINLANSVGDLGIKRGDGTVPNALRHGIWQALLTKHMGNSTAKRVGDAHEDNPEIDMGQRSFTSMALADQAADIHNNIIGRVTAEIYSDAESNQELVGRIVDQHYLHGMWTVKQFGEEDYRLEKKRLTTEEHQRLRDKLSQLDEMGLVKWD